MQTHQGRQQPAWRVCYGDTMPVPDRFVTACHQQGVELCHGDDRADQSCDGVLIHVDGVWFDAIRTVKARVTANAIPVLVWMREASTALRVAAYNAGAADVLMPDIDAAEFAVRLRAAIERAKRQIAPERVDLPARHGTVTVVLRHRMATNGHGPIHLTGVQWRIIRHLLVNSDVSQSHGELIAAVWGIDDDTAARHTLRTHISSIRRQLDLADGVLVTVHGYGYRFHTGTPLGDTVIEAERG